MWYKISGQSVELRIVAKPNAKKTRFVSVTSEGIQLALHAKPQDGAANLALIAFLAEFFAIPKTKIKLKKGASSRYKCVVMPLTETIKKWIESN